MAHRKPVLAAFLALAFVELLGAVFSMPAPAIFLPAPVQAGWIDIGSGETHTIADFNDPLSFERFPPYAFGDWEPGNLLYVEFIPLPCSALPAPDICKDGRFVLAYDAFLYQASCPCSGALVRPVEVELHYDPARLASLGVREEDLWLAAYDGERGEWVGLADQRLIAERDVVAGSRLGNARAIYALLVRENNPASTEASTWGRIKVQWRDR